MSGPVVKTHEGKLRGVLKSDRVGNDFYGFQGIPYAKPPLGELRFKAPQPPESWEGIRDATEEGSECFAKQFDDFSGSEDCLFLNVYTKEILSPRLRPVMFWIHGGGFTAGSSSTKLYGPDFLVTEDIVLVSINYRLGPLGFLNLPDPELGVPGNAGLKDMVMALKWVQRNIKQFSGDPNNVTIFGESAGGTAVQLLCLSPMAKGLFHKAIAQSGCATNCWGISSYTKSAYILAQNAGIWSNDDKFILKHLQQLTLEDLERAMEPIPELHAIGILRPFGPVIEKTTKEPAFISEHPMDIIKSGKYTKVPMIMGTVCTEGMYIHEIVARSKVTTVLKDTTIIPNNMGLRIDSNIHKEAANKVKRFYFGDKDLLADKNLINKFYTDNYFLYEIYKNARSHLETNPHPIYFYRFLFDNDLNFLKHMYGIQEKGVCHADDTAYLFKCDLVPDLEQGSVEELGVLRIVKLWTNFAKYGKPTVDRKDPLLPVDWLPLTKDKFRTYDIGEEVKLHEHHPETKYMKFWDEMYTINPFASKL